MNVINFTNNHNIVFLNKKKKNVGKIGRHEKQ